MRKLLMMLLTLFLLYCLVQISFRFLGPGHNYDYTIETNKKVFKINENYRNKKENNYTLTINYNDNNFYYQTYYDFNKNDHIVKDIYEYSNDIYKCIFIKYKNDKVLSDIMCQNNGVTYFYNNMPDKKSIEPFVEYLNEYGYNVNQWIDNGTLGEANLSVYNNNIIDNHYIALNNYKGLYTINNYNGNKVFNVDLFDKDVYQQDISIFYNSKYLVADYNELYKFKKFILVDLFSNKKTDINSNYEMSFNSYIQGAIDDSIYIFDSDNKKQYEIDIKSKKVIEIGNIDIGVKIYTNNEWTKIDATKASKEKILFDKDYISNINEDGYIRIDRVGNENYGYTYFYKQNGNKYDVYYKNNQQNESLTYIFSTLTIDSVKYIKDYVYYIDGDTLKYYNDETGSRRVLIEKELEFNKNLSFGIYIK